MADSNQHYTSISGTATVSVWQRPSILLMKLQLLAKEPTLELGLLNLKKQGEATSQWLNRLDAYQVDLGEPYFADQAETDPMKKMQTLAQMRTKPSKTPVNEDQHRQINVVVTALWDIASKSAEEILIFLDRLRFEANLDDETESEELLPWASPEEQMQVMLSQMRKMRSRFTNDSPIQFLFIGQLNNQQFNEALAKAYLQAREKADRLANISGRPLGELSSMNYTMQTNPFRTDRMMERQRVMAALANTTYQLTEEQMISDLPHALEFSITLHLTFRLQ